MKTSRLLLVAFLLLATGVFLLCNFTHGDAGFSFSSNIPDTKVNLDLTTTGWPTVIGVPCVLFGTIFLCLAFLSAIGKEILLRKTRRTEAAPLETAPLE
jgi:phosphotransferase system  glucose/maltose/N-acetylglucosamine-specific IIC component